MDIKSIPENKLTDHVERITESGCWIWMGGLCTGGYGQLNFYKKWLVHRVAYELFVGAIPEGLQIDHLCRVRCCVNPAHLEPVSLLENVQRGLSGAYNLAKTHCPRGHEYTPENTYTSKRKMRSCRKCKNIRERAKYRAVN